MIRKQFIGTAVASLLTLGIGTAAQAASIGWNFVATGYMPSSGVELDPSEVAGAPGFQQANWNNHHSGGAQAPGETPFSLVDHNGNATSVVLESFTLTQNNSWAYGGVDANSSPDEKLLNAFADKNPTLVFTGLNSFAPNGYTVVVYYGNNEWWNGNPLSTLTVNGQSQNLRTNDTFANVGYILNNGTATSSVDETNRSNYAVFTGVTGDTLTISLTSPVNDGISAVQIIANPIPEPATLGLMGLGGLLMLRRKRN